MPDKRRHRGPHPEDASLFSEESLPALRRATDELCWLLSRGYASDSSLKLVGDRHRLNRRQRIAVARCAAGEGRVEARMRRRLSIDALAGRPIAVDGYNLLTTIEAALAGGVVLRARDGCYRDMASVHGTWRKVDETVPALQLAGRVLDEAAAADVYWYLDSPVSNSGRLRAVMLELAGQKGWPWSVELVADPDPLLAGHDCLVATADSGVLDRCGPWVNLAREIVARHVPEAWIVDLSAGAGDRG